MTFPLKLKTTIQAAAKLLQLNGGKMNYMYLLKLLYWADREALKETGHPITGDDAKAMKLGPVPIRTYSMILGSGAKAKEWQRCIKTVDYDVVLLNNPGDDELSEYEIEKLTDAFEKHRHLDPFEMSALTHEFPEWEKNKPKDNGQKAIPLDDLLEALGLSSQKIELRKAAEYETKLEAMR